MTRTRTHLPTLIAATLLAACTTSVRLAGSDRAGLGQQAAIHVLHYASPLPAMKMGGKGTAPDPADIQRAAGADPAALVAQGLARVLVRKEKLKNLDIGAQPLAPPVAGSATDYRPAYPEGLVLDVWIEGWSLEPLADNPDTYALRLAGQARLARPGDGHVLWSGARCQVNGTGARGGRLMAAELRDGQRLRKLLVRASDECVRQLARDFYPEETGE
jgi:hypothetical protein